MVPLDGTYKAKDSTIVKNGAFHLKIDCNKPTIYRWEIEKSYESSLLFIEPKGKYKLNFNTYTGEITTAVTSGSEQKIYNAYKKNIVDLYNEKYNQIQNDSSIAKSIRQAKMSRLFVSRKSKELNFIKQHPSSMVSLYILYENNRMGALRYKDLINWLEAAQLDTFKDNLLYQKIMEDKEQKSKLQLIGKSAPNFQLNTPNGKFITLSSFKGKYILLDFWASWCKPCRKANKHLKKIYHKYKGEKFEIISISMDNDKKLWTNAIQKDQINWTSVSDLEGFKNSEIRKKYHVKQLPTTFLLNKEGGVINQNMKIEELKKELENIFE